MSSSVPEPGTIMRLMTYVASLFKLCWCKANKKIQTKVHDRLVVVGDDDDDNSVLLLQLTKRKELKWWIVL